jgi:hypothetical protein
MTAEQRATLVRLAAQQVRTNVEARAVAVLGEVAGDPATSPLSPEMLEVSYAGDSDPYDGSYKGSRITDAAGLARISEQEGELRERFLAACRPALQPWPTAVAQHAAELESMRDDICWFVADSMASRSFSSHIARFYARRRASEIAKVFNYLSARVEPLSGVLSADHERAILYLGRLASRVTTQDGALGQEVVRSASAAQEWRDNQVAGGNITDDMREELAARGELASMEAGFRRNQAISDEIVRQKQQRTPAQQDSARRATCVAVVGTGLVSREDARRSGCP